MSKTPLMRNSNVQSFKLGEDVALLHKRPGVYYRLNQVGVAIWEEMGQLRSSEQLVNSLQADFESPPREIFVDINDFFFLSCKN